MDVLVENTQIDTGIPRVQGIPALNTQSAENQSHGCRRRHGGIAESSFLRSAWT